MDQQQKQNLNPEYLMPVRRKSILYQCYHENVMSGDKLVVVIEVPRGANSSTWPMDAMFGSR